MPPLASLSLSRCVPPESPARPSAHGAGRLAGCWAANRAEPLLAGEAAAPSGLLPGAEAAAAASGAAAAASTAAASGAAAAASTAAVSGDNAAAAAAASKLGCCCGRSPAACGGWKPQSRRAASCVRNPASGGRPTGAVGQGPPSPVASWAGAASGSGSAVGSSSGSGSAVGSASGSASCFAGGSATAAPGDRARHFSSRRLCHCTSPSS
jgi:hypothetical protein